MLAAWPPYQSVDYTKLQFGRVDNVNPPNYQMIGFLPVYEITGP